MNRPRKDTKPYIPHEVPSAAADGSLEETVDMMTANEGVPKDVGLRVIICAAHRTRPVMLDCMVADQPSFQIRKSYPRPYIK